MTCRRAAALVLLLAALLPLSAAAWPEDVHDHDIVTTATVRPDPRLVASYDIPGAGVYYSQVAYRPRQFAAGLGITDPTWGAVAITNAGDYAGWDVLPTLSRTSFRASAAPAFTTVTFNRPAEVAVVWRASAALPDCLAGWTQDGTVGATQSGTARTWTVYRAPEPVTTLVLCGVNAGLTGQGTRDTPWLLFAEGGGEPSPAPPYPDGFEEPVPNQTCPAWVHDDYQTTGPDGLTYATWHPPIDPTYWCYFRHEHGSDPDHFLPGWRPAFDFVMHQHGGTEPHAGFKVLVVDDGNGQRWLFVHHMGTGNPVGAACARYHTVEIAVLRIADQTLLADIRVMADHGPGTGQDRGSGAVPRFLPLTPPACSDQAALATGSKGQRQFPIQDDGFGGTAVMYEPWRMVPNGVALGWLGDGFGINVPDPVAFCNTTACNAVVTVDTLGRTRSGSTRFLTVFDSPAAPFRIVDPGYSADGIFCTDPLGTTVLDCADPTAVPQYVLPGATIDWVHPAATGSCVDPGWGRVYVCGTSDMVPTNREDALRTGTDAAGRSTYGPN